MIASPSLLSEFEAEVRAGLVRPGQKELPSKYLYDAVGSALFEAIAGQDIHRIVAGIALPNPASIALHRRLGFIPVGTFSEVGRKFGRYWDVAWMERALP